MALLKVTEQERRRLWEISRAADAGWRERERVEMVLLADEGWSAPRIARHLGRCAATVRRVLRAYVQGGPEALFTRLAGRKPDMAHRVAAVQFANTPITIAYDFSPKDAAAQRAKQFTAAANNRALVAAPHLPYPGIGHIRAEERGFTFVPVDYRDRAQP